jgi:uncharacterized protein (TIGR02466 family)
MTVRQCFSVPIYAYQFSGSLLELIQQEISLAVKNNRGNMSMPWPESVTSTFNWNGNNHFLDQTPLLKEQILSHYKCYLETANSKEIPTLNLTASFLNIIETQGFQFSHHHPESVISGVYYHQVDSINPSNIVFENPNPVCDFTDPTGQLWPNHAEEVPVNGKMIMFPSWLKHRVNVSNSVFERVAIAFNLA